MCLIFLVRFFEAGIHEYFARHKLAFVPPNPKLLVSATFTACSCATLGI